MNSWTAAGAILVPAAAGAALWRQRRRRRDRLYTELMEQRDASAEHGSIELGAGAASPGRSALVAAFAERRLVRAENFVTRATLARLRDEALAGVPDMDPNYIPKHKKGNTLSYEQILRRAPHLLAFYHSREVRRWMSAVTGTEVKVTPLQDQSSLSVLCYRDAGDHIGWHYDHNFYRGRHFTVLLVLVNRAAGGGPSRSRLERQRPDGSAEVVDAPENTLVIFEGARVRHRDTPSADGDLRVVLSMTYCDDPRIHPLKEAARRIKDTAFFGLRALWD